MAEIEVKLRAGMTRNGIQPKAQEDIVRSITSFALYGFPESHAASFAWRVFEVPLPGGLHLRHAQQSAHGFLFAGHSHQRRAAPRPAGLAGGRDKIRMAVHHRAPQWGRPPGLRGSPWTRW